MAFTIPTQLLAEIDELISHYPEKRSATMMLLHAIQEEFGYISDEAIEWIAVKLGLQPINVLELVTFYPMYRRQPAGKHQIKICRTLSCALNGSAELRAHLCKKLGLDPEAHGVQVTTDGKFSVEFVECLASCGSGPVVMVNDYTYERVSCEEADEILNKCK
jgi:NADH-quinone oxidoreductase subunit E